MDPSLASTKPSSRASESLAKTETRNQNLTESVCKTPPSSERDSPPQLNKALPSRNAALLPTKSKQLKWTIILFSVAVPLFAVSFLYIYAALIAQHPKLGRLLFSPSQTIFVVGLLSQVIALLIKHFFDNIFDALRWQLASRRGGVRTTTFLGLSGATSLLGLTMLICVGGPHIIWCVQRLLLPLFSVLISVILKADFTFKNIYYPILTIPAFGGLMQLNTALLPDIPTSVLCIYFSAWTASILGASKFVTGIAPVACDGTCRSVFLPGGIEIARVLGPDLNHTLLEGGLFDNADVFLIHEAPGYHLEFFPIATDYSFNRTNDCLLYGQSRGQGLYICVGSHDSSLVAGWSICPSHLFTNNLCFSNTTWTNELDQNTSMSVFKRYATVAYDRQNFSILSVESVSPPEPVIYDPSDFRSIYSRAFVPSANKTSDDTIAVEALLFQTGWLLRLYQDDYRDDKETPLTYLQGLLTIPVQFYTAAFEYANATYARNAIILEGNYLNVPSDLETKVSAALIKFRVQAKDWTFWVFCGVVSILMLWCGIIFAWILIQETAFPNISSFAEINFGSKWVLPNSQGSVDGDSSQPGTGGFQSMLWAKRLGNAETRAIVKTVENSMTRVVAKKDSTGDEGVTVLATTGLNSTE